MSEKSKIPIKYIEDSSKRSVRLYSKFFFFFIEFIHFSTNHLSYFLRLTKKHTLYKRKRGLIKKAHELSVMCGLKVSIFCTDFDSSCFTFCNDERLMMDPKQVFKDLEKPINITRFDPTGVKILLQVVNYF